VRNRALPAFFAEGAVLRALFSLSWSLLLVRGGGVARRCSWQGHRSEQTREWLVRLPRAATRTDRDSEAFPAGFVRLSGGLLTSRAVMAEVIQLASFKRKQAARRGFRAWLRRFDEDLDEDTRAVDLSDVTLAFLISPGEENIFLIYELVMGVKDLGTSSDFFNLEKSLKMEVIDISIYLLDQLRFECMRRLGWLTCEGTPPRPIVQLVEKYPTLTADGRKAIPTLSISHPNYDTYERLSDFDKETFVRKQIPSAIEQFKRGLKG
jgi:hypothetical protein